MHAGFAETQMSIPIFFEGNSGDVAAYIRVSFSQALLIIPALILWLLAASLILLVQLRIRNLHARHAVTASALQKAEAIARTTQMLAHDVRKPFTMLQATMDMLHKVRKIEDFEHVRKVALADVQRAITSVNGLLADVMEIGAQSLVATEPTNPTAFVESTLTELFRIFPNTNISVVYKLEHTRCVMADTTKLSRVFLNILGNAIQAMNQAGEITISTRQITENNVSFVEFSLGNNGPHIPKESLGQLFEAFFTQNKKGGTGLGLAIAQRVIQLHGGKIWCESNPESGTSFIFTVPAGDVLEPSSRFPETLFTHSHQFYEHQQRSEMMPAVGVTSLQAYSSQTNAAVLSAEIVSVCKERQHTIRVHVVDDEALYRNAVESALSSDLKNCTEIKTHKNADELWHATAKSAPDLVILDVDLGPASPSGFEVASQIRARNMNSFVCIHTNRVMAADNRSALEAGADAFLPKPLSETHLIKLIAQALERAKVSVSELPSIPSTAPTTATRIAVVDDDAVILMAWELMGSNIICDTFQSPEAFFERLQADATYMASLTAVVTDFHFDNSKQSGVDFADKLKEMHPTANIFLSTNATMGANEIGPSIVAAVPKNPDEALAAIFKMAGK
jgi:signal transduction histidine kinase/CheY-like chemotaxis protein